jgi:hypothetical protein
MNINTLFKAAEPWIIKSRALRAQRDAWRNVAIENAREVARLRAELNAVARARDSAVKMARAVNRRYLRAFK